MRLKFLFILTIIILTSTGCSKDQKAVLLDSPEIRIHVTFDEQNEKNKVEDITKFNEEELKQFYLQYAGYQIKESGFKKVVVRNDKDYIIIDFNPIVSDIELNNSYVVQLHDGYISSISTNPTKYQIPKEIDDKNIISVKKRDKLKVKLRKKYENEGAVDEIIDSLYFDCHEYGKLIYSIKISVDTSDYSFAKVYIYDAYTGDLLNES